MNNCLFCKQVNVIVNESLEFYPGFILPYNYDFALESTKDIFFSLRNLRRDLDLYITRLDQNGEPLRFCNDPERSIINLANSTNGGVEDESIFLRLKPGSYRAYVKENYGANLEFGAVKTSEDVSFTLELDADTFGSTTRLGDDPLLGYQWYLFNTGVLDSDLVNNTQYTGDIATPNVDILAPEAWKIRTDGSQAILAIIDSGVDLFHPDLVDNLWTNPNEIPGNGLDDDDNGYIDDIHGWNFVENSATPARDMHGTHVAGIAAASGNNGIGVSGVAWNAKIMALDIFGGRSKADDENIIEAIHYAVDKGAKVINMSIGLNLKAEPSLETLKKFNARYYNAFEYAKSNDVFIAVAAGNEGGAEEDLEKWKNVGDLDRYISTPAVYSRFFSNVATVVASDSMSERALYSSYGNSATIAAPGGDTGKMIDIFLPGPGEAVDPISATVNYGILSTVPVGTGGIDQDYDFAQGTSMAAPVIAGMATLIRSANASISAQDTLAILRAGANVEPSLGNMVNRGLTANLYESLRLADNWRGPDDLLALQQSAETPVVNLSFLTNGALTIKGQTMVSRSAALDPITGFYKTIDAVGSVYDSLGNIVRPGDAGYAAIALNDNNIVSSISGVSVDDERSESFEFALSESVFLAPFAKVNDHTWFAFKEANSDNFAHFKLLAPNRFGLEDMKDGGDMDFDDHIISFVVDTLA